MDNCETCKFWARDRSSNSQRVNLSGKCKRYPVYTLRFAADWCGEYAFGQTESNKVAIPLEIPPPTRKTKKQPVSA